MSKALSIGILLGSFSLKVPQIMTMVKGKTAQGLSFPSMVMEILLLTLSIGYNLHYGYPVTAYAENVVILFQAYVIFYLAWQYKRVHSNNFFVGAGLGLVVLIMFLTDQMPEEVYVYNQLLVIGLSRLVVISSGIALATDQREHAHQIHRCLVFGVSLDGLRRQLRTCFHHARGGSRQAGAGSPWLRS